MQTPPAQTTTCAQAIQVGTDVYDPYNDNIILISAGARVDIRVPLPPRSGRASRRRAYAAAVYDAFRPGEGGSLHVLMHPFGSALALPLSKPGRTIVGGDRIRKLARQWTSNASATHEELKEEALNRLLLVLWNALMFIMSARWVALGVANNAKHGSRPNLYIGTGNPPGPICWLPPTAGRHVRLLRRFVAWQPESQQRTQQQMHWASRGHQGQPPLHEGWRPTD